MCESPCQRGEETESEPEKYRLSQTLRLAVCIYIYTTKLSIYG